MNGLESLIKNMVPITQFNRGRAGRIFSDVKSGQTKIVMKNNEPEAILISPKKYMELLEKIETLESRLSRLK